MITYIDGIAKCGYNDIAIAKTRWVL